MSEEIKLYAIKTDDGYFIGKQSAWHIGYRTKEISRARLFYRYQDASRYVNIIKFDYRQNEKLNDVEGLDREEKLEWMYNSLHILEIVICGFSEKEVYKQEQTTNYPEYLRGKLGSSK